MSKRFVSRRLSKHAFIIALIHVVAFAFAYWLAFSLRFDFNVPTAYGFLYLATLPAVVFIKLAIFYYQGHCHTSWRYVTFSDLTALIRSATLSTLIILSAQPILAGLFRSANEEGIQNEQQTAGVDYPGNTNGNATGNASNSRLSLHGQEEERPHDGFVVDPDEALQTQESMYELFATAVSSDDAVSNSDVKDASVGVPLANEAKGGDENFLPKNIPLRVLLVDWGMTIMLVGGLRVLSRLSREEMRPLFSGRSYTKALIVGATASGETLARHLQQDEHSNYLVVGFLDPEKWRHGSMLAQIPVLGGPESAPEIAAALGVEVVLVLSESLSGNHLRLLMDKCAEVELKIKVIPALDDLLHGDYGVQIRDVNIDDLLSRDPIKLDDDEISDLLHNRTVLVTGAGGSIGSEICRQVLKFSPAKLVLVEQAENSLFYIDQELKASITSGELVPCIADITESERMQQIFEQHRPDVVFHAAAHKHVPMMEHNPGEAIKNNVIGTKTLVEMADRFKVQHFVMISTDKAVNPTSIMGVSKQIAERYVHAFSEVSETKFVVVRFGNVLASNGSVVPIFQEQIRRGGPVTVTHPEIERFFMTIPEASQLVLQAAAMGKGGEIFVLDMGEPVLIVDLARDLIRLSGLDSEDIEIKFTGLRPGEKLYEELYFDDERRLPTPHPKVTVADHRPYNLGEVRESIDGLMPMVHGSIDQLRDKLREVVHEYHPLQAAAGEVNSNDAAQEINSKLNNEPEGDSTVSMNHEGPVTGTIHKNGTIAISQAASSKEVN